MPETNYFFFFEIGSCWPWKQWRTGAIFHSLSSAIYNIKVLVFEMIRAHFDTKQIDRGLGGLYTYRWRQRKSGERKEYLPRERSTVKNKEGKIIALPPPLTPTVHCSSKSNTADRKKLTVSESVLGSQSFAVFYYSVTVDEESLDTPAPITLITDG